MSIELIKKILAQAGSKEDGYPLLRVIYFADGMPYYHDGKDKDVLEVNFDEEYIKVKEVIKNQEIIKYSDLGQVSHIALATGKVYKYPYDEV